MFKSLLKHLKPLPRVEIETERFTLRALPRSWIGRNSLQWSGDPEFLQGLGWPAGPHSSRAWTRRFYKANNRTSFHFAIFPRGSGTLIGVHGVKFSEPGSAMLYVAIGDRNWWGKGVVQEVRSALIDFVFDTAGGHRVYGHVHGRNPASIFNYQRLGFHHEGTLRQHRILPDTGEPADMLMFGLLKEEWRARQDAAKGAALR